MDGNHLSMRKAVASTCRLSLCGVPGPAEPEPVERRRHGDVAWLRLLLDDMRQFVRDQAPPLRIVRRESSGTENHVIIQGEGVRADFISQLSGAIICVDAHMTEIVGKATLHSGPQFWWQWLAIVPQSLRQASDLLGVPRLARPLRFAGGIPSAGCRTVRGGNRRSLAGHISLLW